LYYSSYPEAGGKSPFGELFDAPDAMDCYRRTETIVPQQALALTNSELVHKMAAAVVTQWPPVASDNGTTDLPGFIDAAFLRVLSRAPTSAEREACLTALTPSQPGLTTTSACESLIRALFNHHEFVTIR
jgi:hypothetical protein